MSIEGKLKAQWLIYVRESSIRQDHTIFAVRNSNISGDAISHETIEESSPNIDVALCSVGFPLSMGQPVTYLPETIDDQHAVKDSPISTPAISNNNEGLQNLNQDNLGGCCGGWKSALFCIFWDLKTALK